MIELKSFVEREWRFYQEETFGGQSIFCESGKTTLWIRILRSGDSVCGDFRIDVVEVDHLPRQRFGQKKVLLFAGLGVVAIELLKKEYVLRDDSQREIQRCESETAILFHLSNKTRFFLYSNPTSAFPSGIGFETEDERIVEVIRRLEYEFSQDLR